MHKTLKTMKITKEKYRDKEYTSYVTENKDPN